VAVNWLSLSPMRDVAGRGGGDVDEFASHL
jgi:hypothetical protein